MTDLRRTRQGQRRLTRIILTAGAGKPGTGANRTGNGFERRPGYIRDVVLAYHWMRAPKWIETERRVFSSSDAWPYFRDLETKPREHLMALYLNGGNVPIAVETVHIGKMTETYCCPGEILRSALHLGAAAVIVAHNHPSGNPRPSPNDEYTFKRLQEAAALVDVKILDSLIIGHGTYYSLTDAKTLEMSLGFYKEGAARREARRKAIAAKASKCLKGRAAGTRAEA